MTDYTALLLAHAHGVKVCCDKINVREVKSDDLLSPVF